jgi:hypothetical protein
MIAVRPLSSPRTRVALRLRTTFCATCPRSWASASGVPSDRSSRGRSSDALIWGLASPGVRVGLYDVGGLASVISSLRGAQEDRKIFATLAQVVNRPELPLPPVGPPPRLALGASSTKPAACPPERGCPI